MTNERRVRVVWPISSDGWHVLAAAASFTMCILPSIHACLRARMRCTGVGPCASTSEGLILHDSAHLHSLAIEWLSPKQVIARLEIGKQRTWGHVDQ